MGFWKEFDKAMMEPIGFQFKKQIELSDEELIKDPRIQKLIQENIQLKKKLGIKPEEVEQECALLLPR